MTNPDVLKALLAMDSYNRGYNAGISGLSNTPGTQIGDATIVVDSSVLGANTDFNAGFYAIAYQMPNDATWGGETIISYRGTDNKSLLSELQKL